VIHPSERPQLLAIDLDGTLVEPLHPVRPAVLAAVARAVDAGVRVTIVTGRMYVGAAPLVAATRRRGADRLLSGRRDRRRAQRSLRT
jgi:hydroxymethylpyrimidine pyrophosphatase-like HAD family hydrolase